MPVQVDIAVGDFKTLLPVTVQFPDRSGQVDFFPAFHSRNLYAIAFRENRFSRFRIHQSPERTRLHKPFPRLGLQAVETREQQVHCLPRPAPKDNSLVIFRHTGNLRPLHQKHPEDSLVQRLVPAHAELLGVPDGGFLEELEEF